MLEPPGRRPGAAGPAGRPLRGSSEPKPRLLIVFAKGGMVMSREESDILTELCESIAQSEQRSGTRPGRGVTSLSVSRRIADFARQCRSGELKGRARKRKANCLLLEVLRSLKTAP